METTRRARRRWAVFSMAWAAVIFCLSSAGFSSAHTGRALQWVLACLPFRLTPDGFDSVHFFIRKLAHLGEYGVFAILLYGWFRAGRRPRFSAAAALLALAVAGAFSLTDEFHQTFVPARTGSCGTAPSTPPARRPGSWAISSSARWRIGAGSCRATCSKGDGRVRFATGRSMATVLMTTISLSAFRVGFRVLKLNLPSLKGGESHGSHRRFLLRPPPDGMAPQTAILRRQNRFKGTTPAAGSTCGPAGASPGCGARCRCGRA